MPVCCADPVVLAACRFGLAPAALAVCRLGFGLLAFAACCFGLELAALAAGRFALLAFAACCLGLEPAALAACFGFELAAVAAFGLGPAAFGLGPAALAPVAACFGFELVAFRVFDGAAISVLLPAAATRGRAFLAVSSEFPELLPGRLQHALGFVLGAALLHVADKPRQALLLLGDVKPVDGLGEPQVGIDACDDDAGVDSQNLDANQRNSHVRVDDQPFVKDRVDDIGESRGRW